VFVEHDATEVHSIEVYTDIVGLRLALGLPVSSVAEAADTSRLAGDTGGNGLRVFVRPEDRRAPPPRRRRHAPGVLAAVAAVAAVLLAGALILTTLPSGTSTAEPTRPAATPTPAGATPTPSSTRTKAQPKPKPSSGVVERGNNLDLSTDVLFDRGSAVLSGRARSAIAEVARVMRARDVRGVVRVNGYTDNLGSAAYGMTLSRQRAEAVAAALRPQLRGVQVTLRSQGLGEANPVASNATETGRQRNRRVTIVLPKP
jgi:outer membrane protein OmpA-like peptidoglycan-associated protein